jgi:predicted  nucleic acid-binding Zn-ribbon protein
MQEREHRLELLIMDKAYLTREAESLNDRLATCTQQRDDLAAQLADAKSQHEALCQRLLMVRSALHVDFALCKPSPYK